jgi:DNA-binding MurR/RpiR family transcriptional regulator
LEPLRRRIEEGFPRFTKSEKRLAHYLCESPEGLLVETSVSLARSVGVSPMTISRFVRKVGFDSLSEAKSSLKRELFGHGKPSGHGGDQTTVSLSHEMDLRANADAEIASLHGVYTLRSTPAWAQVVDSLANAHRVFAAGFQTTRSIALALADRLEYVRPHVRFVDGVNGTYTEVLQDRAERLALVIIDTYRYSKNSRVLAEMAVAQGREVTIISDEFCHWAREITDSVLTVTTGTGLSRPSTTALSLLSNLLIEDVSERLGDEVSVHLDAVASAQESFDQYA